MKRLNIITAIFLTFWLAGCNESTSIKTTDSEDQPKLEFVDANWMYKGNIVQGSRDIAKIIDSRTELLITVPSEMEYAEFSKIWHKAKNANIELQISISGSTEKSQSIFLINYDYSPPSEERPEIEPILIGLLKDGLYVNRVKVTNEEFKNRMNDYSEMAKSAGCEPLFNYFVQDKVTVGRLVKFLKTHEQIKFQITFNEFIYFPDREKTIEVKPTPPRSFNMQDLLKSSSTK